MVGLIGWYKETIAQQALVLNKIAHTLNTQKSLIYGWEHQFQSLYG